MTPPAAASLLPLPKPVQKGWIYTAEQMRAYAAACVAHALAGQADVVTMLRKLVNACDAHGESMFYGDADDQEDEDIASSTEHINAVLDEARTLLAKAQS